MTRAPPSAGSEGALAGASVPELPELPGLGSVQLCNLTENTKEKLWESGSPLANLCYWMLLDRCY